MEEEKRFIIGVNYWPRETAMHWWKNFDSSIVKRDFSLMAEFRFERVRIFLLWEDFQWEMKRISVRALDDLVRVADMAHDVGIQVLPTFFCGHMSGVNWLPPWMIESGAGDEGFPLFSSGKIQRGKIRNLYADREVRKAQKLLIHETTDALRGHPAVWGWDLGNKPSNLVIPPSKDSSRAWLEEMVNELKRWDANLPVTLGMHQADLEEDRVLGPKEAASYCDLLSIHAHPGNARWADGVLDEKAPLFLALVTQWLGGKEVLVEEFGVPTKPDLDLLPEAERRKLEGLFLAEENEAEIFYHETLDLLSAHGIQGALARCFSDYDSSIWDKPPLDNRVHERFFGLFRWNGSAKPAARLFRDYPRKRTPREISWDWVDIRPEEYGEDPGGHLARLYRRFKDRF